MLWIYHALDQLHFNSHADGWSLRRPSNSYLLYSSLFLKFRPRMTFNNFETNFFAFYFPTKNLSENFNFPETLELICFSKMLISKSLKMKFGIIMRNMQSIQLKNFLHNQFYTRLSSQTPSANVRIKVFWLDILLGWKYFRKIFFRVVHFYTLALWFWNQTWTTLAVSPVSAANFSLTFLLGFSPPESK